MNQIKIKCSCCNEDILLDIDNDFNVLSVKHINKELSELDTNQYLRENNIEFG